MATTYLFRPKNPMLHHCSESFYKAMTFNLNSEKEADYLYYLTSVNVDNGLDIAKKIFKLNSGDTIYLFFFLIQSDYLVLTLILKAIAQIFSKDLKIYYMMHEPRFEKGRINPIKAFLIFIYHFLFGHLADKILLPSDKALFQAKTFIKPDKLYKLNLTFLSPLESLLQKNLQQLKCSWDNNKTFSLLGRIDIDKNPQGFLDLVNIINEYYPEQARFIRGGRDRNVDVPYDEELIIRFSSFLSDSAKSFLFGLTHFVVIPYSFSTQSGVLAEALSYGKLLIINDIPAFSSLKDLNFLFLVDFNNKDAILECIHKLLNMDICDYENRYWQAVKYFQEHHSETYLLKALKDIL
ncbi:hypothetical protein I8748_16005 [Nostoc sp. CENA67]|uniref:Glycosyltransferase n=1 Tax=Amazonocrinis nigriterrae CENA67 TaxID=2794033 RepID=A0A8J7LBF5_9NOST|nr:hypothetical protein [Amazonocrinis nigriterrae]MBH8563676.1 hypothetical protein [Amazonocrinis nigriterrae CENA67]